MMLQLFLKCWFFSVGSALDFYTFHVHFGDFIFFVDLYFGVTYLLNVGLDLMLKIAAVTLGSISFHFVGAAWRAELTGRGLVHMVVGLVVLSLLFFQLQQKLILKRPTYFPQLFLWRIFNDFTFLGNLT